MPLRLGLAASGAMIAAMFAVTAWAWGQFPADAQLPVHWGLSGEADRYGGKGEALLVVPVLALVLTAVFTVLPKVEPRREHLEQSATAYLAVWIATMLEMGIVHAAIVLAALGYPINVAAAVTGGIGLLFVVIGRVLGSVQSNFMFGVRTPWTLSSERSWQRTHQLAGRLFMALGALVTILAFVAPPPVLFAVLMGGIVITLVAVVVYSWQMWRTDPARQVSGR